MIKTIKEAEDREKSIEEELERLKKKEAKSPEDHAQVPILLEEFREVHARLLDLRHDAALQEIRSAKPAGRCVTLRRRPARWAPRWGAGRVGTDSRSGPWPGQAPSK